MYSGLSEDQRLSQTHLNLQTINAFNSLSFHVLSAH